MNKKDLIIDALNMYYRAYIVDPSLSSNGDPIGGLKGFIKILQKLVRETKPSKIIICWDGPGGSQKRKSTNKNYKAGRKPIRLNRDIRNLTEPEETANKIWQQRRLIEYLNEFPITQTMIENVEADDVIAYAAQLPSLRGWIKIIVSSDKDFLQLCDDETILHRPIQKEFLNKGRIVEKFGIHPTNFALARALVGDKSDNLPGVDRVGLGTVAKRFPFMADEESATFQDIYDTCEEVENKLKVHHNILENKSLIEQNYKMMQLYTSTISPQNKAIVKNSIENIILGLNKTEIRAMMMEDGFGVLDLSSLFQNCRRIVDEEG